MQCKVRLKCPHKNVSGMLCILSITVICLGHVNKQNSATRLKCGDRFPIIISA